MLLRVLYRLMQNLGHKGRKMKLVFQKLTLTSFDPGNEHFQEIRSQIEEIDLSNNNITDCPVFASVSKWQLLTRLDLSRNNLKTVDKTVFMLPVINELKLGGNKLHKLPVLDLDKEKYSPTLMVLYLENNKLTSLPSSLSRSSIKSLYLQGNQFESVPSFLCNMDWLTYLNLSHNPKILELPVEFGKLNPKITLDVKEGMSVIALFLFSIIYYIGNFTSFLKCIMHLVSFDKHCCPLKKLLQKKSFTISVKNIFSFLRYKPLKF